MNKKEEIYFKNILEALCRRATCNRAYVAAVIIKNNYIISTGYNGAPRGCRHCNNTHIISNNHCINTVHAEINAILNAAKNGININECEMVCTHKPCFRCMQALINSGIKKVYYYIDYKDEFQKYFEKNKYTKFIKI